MTLSPNLKFNRFGVESGLPLEAIDEFIAASGVPLKDLLEVVIPLRTLKHRKAKGQALSLEESERLARVVRVFTHTLQVFGDPGKALRWFTNPKMRFQDKTPLELLRTEFGGQEVDQLLGQIAHGMFA
jgi:putative toxin-antitoxin system antitoxin component (TIGR02293 family)